MSDLSAKLTGKEKLKKPDEYKKAAKKGFRLSTENISVSIVKRPKGEGDSEGETLKTARLGITIPNRVEKSAVKRNKARRLVREFFRLNKDKFNVGSDYSFYIRKNIFKDYKVVEQEIIKLLKKQQPKQ